ncbi:MAG: hypothetical protein H6621_08045 [Halobacteriovoraceae bacterium]|nr:hypothetical protein [Halobacteriovoraceae bacterium]
MLEIKRYYAKTSQGPYLNVNEDTCDCDLEKSLFMLLDGFGGAGIGDKTVNFIKEQLKSFYFKTTEDLDATMPFYFNFHYGLELNALINSLICSHRLLLKENEEKPLNQKGGASGLFACQSDDLINVVSIGNGSAFLFRGGELLRIFDREQCFDSLTIKKPGPFTSNIPNSTIGMYYHLDYFVKEVRLIEGDLLMMATDGAVNRLGNADLTRIIGSSSNNSLMNIASQVFSENNSLGNKDNQSIILMEF